MTKNKQESGNQDYGTQMEFMSRDLVAFFCDYVHFLGCSIFAYMSENEMGFLMEAILCSF